VRKSSITHLLCVCECVALFIQHAERLGLIILSSAAYLASPYFSTFYITNSIIFEKKLLNIKCVMISSANFVRNIFHSKDNSATYFDESKQAFM
jgi:hypothetical protein